MYLMLYNSNFYFIFSKQKQIISNRFDANQLLNSLKISHQQKLLLYLNLQQNVLDIHTFIAKFNSEPNIDDNMKIGFSKFLNCLDLYLDQQIDIADINESNISIYGSVTLENGTIIQQVAFMVNLGLAIFLFV